MTMADDDDESILAELLRLRAENVRLRKQVAIAEGVEDNLVNDNERLRAALCEILAVVSGTLTVHRPLLAVVSEIADAGLTPSRCSAPEGIPDA
jgi:hypothetical protein